MRPRPAALVALAVVALAGCRYPSSAPIIDQRWILATEGTAIRVGQLLPAGVSDNGSTFAVRTDPFSQTETLGDLCAVCRSSAGLVPKPAFESTFVASGALPAGVLATTLTSGSVQVSLRNGFGFDPIRPGGEPGRVTITIQDGTDGRALGRWVLDGTTDSLPPGSTTTEMLSLSPGSLGPTVVAAVTVVSPAGDSTTIDGGERITVTVAPSSLLIGSAEVTVADRSVDIDQVSLDVGDIDRSIIDHINQGGLYLEVTNPFGVSVTGDLQVGGDEFDSISKGFMVAPDPRSTTSVSFTAEELKRFLGRPSVRIGGTGTASAPGPVTLRAGQEIRLDTRLDVSLTLGG